MDTMVNNKVEIEEAIVAGKRALDSLYEAQSRLDSAKGWSWFDVLGGGFLSDMIKHGKMQEASDCIEEAKYNLDRFQKELRDVDMALDLRIEVGGFLSFADVFFDGFVADMLVQSKIEDARRRISEAIHMVENVLQTLERAIES